MLTILLILLILVTSVIWFPILVTFFTLVAAVIVGLWVICVAFLVQLFCD